MLSQTHDSMNDYILICISLSCLLTYVQCCVFCVKDRALIFAIQGAGK